MNQLNPMDPDYIRKKNEWYISQGMRPMGDGTYMANPGVDSADAHYRWATMNRPTTNTPTSGGQQTGYIANQIPQRYNQVSPLAQQFQGAMQGQGVVGAIGNTLNQSGVFNRPPMGMFSSGRPQQRPMGIFSSGRQQQQYNPPTQGVLRRY